MNRITADGLEKTLVKFLERLFRHQLLKTNRLALAQPIDREPFEETCPEAPRHVYSSVPYEEISVPPEIEPDDPALALMQPPKIVAGWIPRNVTGLISLDQVPDYPVIILQTTGVEYQYDEAVATVRLLIGAYDEDPDYQGYKDCLNMAEAIAHAFFAWRVIDDSYSLVPPAKWAMIEADTFPHFLAEMTTQWELPTATWLGDDTIHTYARRRNGPNLPNN